MITIIILSIYNALYQIIKFWFEIILKGGVVCGR